MTLNQRQKYQKDILDLVDGLDKTFQDELSSSLASRKKIAKIKKDISNKLQEALDDIAITTQCCVGQRRYITAGVDESEAVIIPKDDANIFSIIGDINTKHNGDPVAWHEAQAGRGFAGWQGKYDFYRKVSDKPTMKTKIKKG